MDPCIVRWQWYKCHMLKPKQSIWCRYRWSWRMIWERRRYRCRDWSRGFRQWKRWQPSRRKALECRAVQWKNRGRTGYMEFSSFRSWSVFAISSSWYWWLTLLDDCPGLVQIAARWKKYTHIWESYWRQALQYFQTAIQPLCYVCSVCQQGPL